MPEGPKKARRVEAFAGSNSDRAELSYFVRILGPLPKRSAGHLVITFLTRY
jgi:hypothetical protein